MSKFENIQENIKQILVNNPSARDCDFALVSLYAARNYPQGIPSFTQVLIDMKSGKMPGFDTITRLRRKIQQLYPVLRGNDYNRRKKVMQPKVRDDMNNFQAPAILGPVVQGDLGL